MNELLALHDAALHADREARRQGTPRAYRWAARVTETFARALPSDAGLHDLFPNHDRRH